MCLSTVYINEKSEGSIVLRNVMHIECAGKVITLTDIMGREAKVEGTLLSADLTGGTVVLKASA